MITFYHPNQPYGCFSNFSEHPVTIFDRTWRTSEHPFQAMKYHHIPGRYEEIYQALTPGRAAKLGRDRDLPIRSDWDSRCNLLEDLLSLNMTRVIRMAGREDCVPRTYPQEPVLHRTKDFVMARVVLEKFSQHYGIRDVLLATGTQPLVEDAEFDPYWGWGCSRNGQNKLGRILMGVRAVLSSPLFT